MSSTYCLHMNRCHIGLKACSWRSRKVYWPVLLLLFTVWSPFKDSAVPEEYPAGLAGSRGRICRSDTSSVCFNFIKFVCIVWNILFVGGDEIRWSWMKKRLNYGLQIPWKRCHSQKSIINWMSMNEIIINLHWNSFKVRTATIYIEGLGNSTESAYVRLGHVAGQVPGGNNTNRTFTAADWLCNTASCSPTKAEDPKEALDSKASNIRILPDNWRLSLRLALGKHHSDPLLLFGSSNITIGVLVDQLW